LDLLNTLIPELSQSQWLIHGFIFVANIVLFILARPLLKIIDPNSEKNSKIKIFRAVNILIFILHIIDLVLLRSNGAYQNYFINLGYSLMIVYGAMLLYSFLCMLSKKRFGKEKLLDSNTVYIDTYSTRLVDLVLLVIIVLTAIYVLIKIWGADSLLETTGIFGILIAFLAFTSNIWAPDIVSGLIILNTEILEDGDVVVIEGHKDEYVISRVTLIYVVLYDIRNNHRTLLRNSQFTQSRIDNLSRVASTDGIRQALLYKIGYPKITGGERDTRMADLTAFKNKVDGMFTAAFENCKDAKNIKINENRPFEWALTSAGDFALEYTLWIYLERIPNSKITSTLRRHLMGTIYAVNEAVYTSSIAHDIDLSTPNVHQVSVAKEA